jgi:site-specific recombinase XerD
MTSLESLIGDYGNARAARGVKANTIYVETVKVRIFASWLLRRGVLDIHAVAPEHITAFQQHLAHVERRTRTGPKKLSAIYRRDVVAAVCRFFEWLVIDRRIIINPAATIELGRASRISRRT